jgi:uncharacterized membrane protein YfcA
MWLAGAGILALASFVFGLAGFGLGLVALSLLPFLMPPTPAVSFVSMYSAVFGNSAVRCHPEICYHLSGMLKFEMHSITHGGVSYGERRL